MSPVGPGTQSEGKSESQELLLPQCAVGSGMKELGPECRTAGGGLEVVC